MRTGTKLIISNKKVGQHQLLMNLIKENIIKGKKKLTPGKTFCLTKFRGE